jgi:hypothetical protein
MDWVDVDQGSGAADLDDLRAPARMADRIGVGAHKGPAGARFIVHAFTSAVIGHCRQVRGRSAAAPRPRADYGDSVENGLGWASQAFSGLNRTRDLVFVEQSGTPGAGCRLARDYSRLRPPIRRPSAPGCAAAWPRRAVTRATTPRPQPSATWTRSARRWAIRRSTCMAPPTGRAGPGLPATPTAPTCAPRSSAAAR